MEEDYIRDPLYGHIKLGEIEFKLINTPEFRRLKRIKQLSLARCEYHSANHTRFEHCIGTYFVTERIIQYLEENSKKIESNYLKEYKNHVKIAALLHDIGHSAFSHTIEQIVKDHPDWIKTKINHEITGFNLITNDSNINRILKEGKYSKQDIKLIGSIATENLSILKKDQYFLTDIITGDLGSDRIDYLLRDSYHAGLPYGVIEVEQLISNLCISTKGNVKRVCVKFDEDRRGLTASSFLLIGRQHHYEAIAYHSKIRSLNVLLKKAIELYIDGEINKKREISFFFNKYDDDDLLNRLISKKGHQKNATIKKLVESIKKEEVSTKYNFFKKIDDFPPQINLMLQIINQHPKAKLKLRHAIEDKIRFENNIEEDELLIFDMDLNGKKGIPSSLFLEVDDFRSCLIFDKAPLTESLSIFLAKMGSLAIYSDKQINVNFYDLSKEIQKIVEEIRIQELISEEFVLISLIKAIAHLKEYENEIKRKIMDRDIDQSFAGLGRFNNIIRDLLYTYKLDLYSDFTEPNPEFYYSPNLYSDIILLASCNLINIIRKPICLTKVNNEVKPSDLDINNLSNVKTMVDRYDFSLTTRGADYVYNIIVPSKKCRKYKEILRGLE